MEFEPSLSRLECESQESNPANNSLGVTTGFPSPANDYLDTKIDLNKQLIHHPSSTFFLRVKGHAMTDSGIQNNDLLIIDRSLDPKPESIIAVAIEGLFTLRKLTRQNGKLYLESNQAKDPLIDLLKTKNIEIWGVAIYSIHNLISPA